MMVPSRLDNADAVYNRKLLAILGDPATGTRLRIGRLSALSRSTGEGVPRISSLDSVTCKQANWEKAVWIQRAHPTSYAT